MNSVEWRGSGSYRDEKRTTVRTSRDVESVKTFQVRPVRLMSFGEARWLLPDGEFTYGEFNLVDITYNGR